MHNLHNRNVWLLQPLVDCSLDLSPEVHDMGIAKRQNLGTNHTSHALFAISPPEQISNASPPPGRLGATSRPVIDHKRDAPALRWVAFLGVHVAQDVG